MRKRAGLDLPGGGRRSAHLRRRRAVADDVEVDGIVAVRLQLPAAGERQAEIVAGHGGVGDGPEDGPEESLRMKHREVDEGKKDEGDAAEALHEGQSTSLLQTDRYKMDKIVLLP